MRIVLLFLVAAPLVAGQRPPRDAGSARPGTASISGRVLEAGTSAPLRRVRISLSAAELREPRNTATDARGRYRLDGLPAGRYSVSATKAGYVGGVYGRTRPFEPGLLVEVGAGQADGDVDFSLARGAVITGRIVDEFGDAAESVEVATLRYQYLQGRRDLVFSSASSATNDLGEFRLAGLPTGEYYLVARPPIRNGVIEISDDRTSYLPTYFPGTGRFSEAQPLKIVAGQVINNINMVLTVTPAVTVTGVMVDRDGRPAASAFVSLETTGTAPGLSAARSDVMVRPDGSFTLSNVAPGDYVISGQFAEAGSHRSQHVSVPVSVGSDDLTGIRLTTARAASVSGRVVLVGKSKNVPSPSGLRLRADAADHPDPTGRFVGFAEVKSDFTFRLESRPCVCVIRPVTTPGGWYLHAVRLNGVDVTDSGISIAPEQEFGGLEVELTNEPTQMVGTVVDPGGEPARHFTVIVFPRDRERWRPPSRYIGAGRPDQRGRYLVRGLPAGEYLAIALGQVEPGEWMSADFLERVREQATPVSVGDGETRTVDLKLVPVR